MSRALPVLALILAASAATAEDVRAALVEALRGNGCSMTESEADSILPGLGLSKDDVFAATRLMVAAGEATLSADQSTLTLSPALCSGKAEVVPPPQDPELALATALDDAALRSVLEGYARDRGCWVQMIEPVRTAQELTASATRLVSDDLILSPAAQRAIEARFAELLDNPGPAYDTDAATGDLTLRDCTP